MQFIITEKNESAQHRLTVFNCGYRVAIHYGKGRYIRRLIRKYSDWVNHPSAACYGKPVKAIWV